MEDTEALLSKLVHTKAMEKALAPIAAQVSQLILMNGAYESGAADSFPANMVTSGAAVQRSTLSLVTAARQITQHSPDEELTTAMPRACDDLSAAGENLVTAAQRLHMEQCSLGARRHLLRCSKDVLEATLKVMLVTDDAEVRKVVRASKWLTDRLAALIVVKDMKLLVHAFKAFTEALMLFTKLSDKRQVELINRRHRDAVVGYLATLKKAVPMLSSAMQTYVKYPNDTQAKISKEFAVGQVLESVQDIVTVLENKPTPGLLELDEEDEEPGHFVTTIDKVLLYLSEEKRLNMASMGSDFDRVTEAAVRHSMTVAHLAAARHRELIIKNCQRILRQRSHVSELSKNVNILPDLNETSEDFGSACDVLLSEFRDLERHVAAAVTHLIVEVFRESTEPLDRLCKAALSHTATDEELDELVEVFRDHCDRMTQVARLTAAGSDNSKAVCTIRSCATQLERLDPELVPAALMCGCEPGNTAAMEHLRLLKQQWGVEVELLLRNIDSVTDARTFVWLSELELRDVVSQCKASSYSDPTQIQLATRSLIGRCRRLAVVSKTLVETSEDPMYRSLLKLYVTHLNKIVHSVKSSARNVLEQPSISDLHKKLHARCDLCMKCVSKLREAMDGGAHLTQPTTFSAKGVLNFDDVADDEDDAPSTKSKDNTTLKSTEQATEISKQDKESAQKKQVVQSYIAELTSDDLAELIRRVTSAAVAGQRGQLDHHGNDVLTRGNHITEQANTIATVVKEDKKQHLHTVVAEVNKLSGRLVSLSRQVCDCDSTAVEDLHDTAQEWAKQVSYLESYVDSIVMKWKTVADKVLDAAKMANIPLLSAQVQLVRAHSSFLGNLITTAVALVSSSDVFLSEHAQCVQEVANDFYNQTTMLVMQADNYPQKEASESSRIELALCGREWASKAFTTTHQLDHLSDLALGKLGRVTDVKESEEMQNVMKACREETIRCKSLVAMVAESAPEKRSTRCHALLSQCDRLLSSMEDETTNMRITGRSLTSSASTTEVMYAPHAWRVWYWQWAHLIAETYSVCDDVTADFKVMEMGRVLASTGTKVPPASPIASPSASLLEFKQRWSQGRAKVLEALQGVMQDREKKQKVKNYIEQLNAIVTEMDALIDSLKDGCDDISVGSSRQKMFFLQRQWAALCQHMMFILQEIQGTNTTALIDAHHFLSGGKSEASPASVVLHGSTEPWWKSSSSSSKRTPRVKFDDLHTPQNVTIEDLTGSLLDFADDLLDHSLEDTADLDTDQSGGFFSADDSTKTILNNSSSPSSQNTTIGKTFDTTDKTMDKTNKTLDKTDKTYKSLSQGPKTHHTTPDKPSSKSGYKPMKKSPPSKSGLHVLGSEVDKWEDDNNAIVTVAKEMSTQLQDMADYTHQSGLITSRSQLISVAKQIAKNGSKLVSFAKILAQHCIDKRCSSELVGCCDYVPTVIAQLSILASVKATADDDGAAEKQLLSTAQNLVGALNRMLHTAEGAAIRGFKEAEGLDESQALILATTWKRRLNQHRMIETSSADTDNLGLRKVNHNTLQPALSHIAMTRRTGMQQV